MTTPTEPLKIGRYEVKAELGRGGMAVVYRAFDPQVRREVAVKVLPPQFYADPDFRARFEREAQMVAALEHPAIVPLYDYGDDRGQLYFVMRLMAGGSLVERIKRGPLPLDECARIISRVAPGLDDAHKRGIIHRDLKPGNILFDQHNDPYISDFGIAKQLDSGGTATGSILGTPAYMSPEQGRGERDIDGRSDVYTLGAILFQMLTKRVPYDADTPIGVVLRHMRDPVPELRAYRDDLPAACQEVLNRAMAKDAADRFATAGKLAEALSAVVRGEPVGHYLTVRRAQNAATPPTIRMQSAPEETARLKVPQHPAQSPMWLVLGSLVLGLLALLAVTAIGAMVLPGVLAPSATADRQALSLASQIAATHLSETQTAVARIAMEDATRAAASTEQAGLANTQQFELAATDTAIALAQSTVNAAGLETQAAATSAAATLEAQAQATRSAQATQNALLSAQKIAFFKDADIWVIDADGANLRQVTSDGASKSNLRWLPDGQTIAYISGRCILTVHFLTLAPGGLGCFNSSSLVEGFEVTQDGKYFAVSVDRITYVGDFVPDLLAPITNYSQLRPLSNCMTFSRSATQYLRWSADASRIAIMVIGVSNAGLAADTLQLLRFECGNSNPINFDQFPGTRFTLPKFTSLRKFQDFGWDGRDLFALIDYVRNDGFGNMYIYNTGTKRAPVALDPLGGCCYRDPNWSPDGLDFVFAYQDQSLGSLNKIELYVGRYNTVLSGGRLSPLPLPEGFFTDPQDRPHPAISP